MSTDCENLLKRFLVLNPVKRGVLTNIMNDKWININYEADHLQPYKEPDLFRALAEDRIGELDLKFCIYHPFELKRIRSCISIDELNMINFVECYNLLIAISHLLV